MLERWQDVGVVEPVRYLRLQVPTRPVGCHFDFSPVLHLLSKPVFSKVIERHTV